MWARRASGRFAVPGLLLLAMLALAGATGAFVVPESVPRAGLAVSLDMASGINRDRDVAARQGGGAGSLDPEPTPSGDQEAPGAPTAPGTEGRPAGSGEGQPAVAGEGRPADALTSWAIGMSGKVGVPAVALEAYGYAELITLTSKPNCKLSWTTLAGIGKIESNHGRANATLNPDGKAVPTIVGAPLDGLGGRDRIPDTDAGRLDGDRTWDRAVGPMQFIPTTWQQYAVDADRDGTTDPSDVDDAALAAANYLCAGNRDLSSPTGWWSAIESYNAVRVYTQDVFRAANDYGQRSH